MGQMQTGLQYIKEDGAFYYFDENGYMQTGKETNVEDDDDAYNFYFITKNGKNGQGQTGEKDGYLYFGGKRLEADDDYRVYYCDGKYWLVNNKGKYPVFREQEVRCRRAESWYCQCNRNIQVRVQQR